MTDIDELRGSMDGITLEMIKLYMQRTDVARRIGDVKKNTGKSVTDQLREDNLRSKVMELSKDIGLDGAMASRFLSFLLNESIRVQSGDRQDHLSMFQKARHMEQQGKKIIHMEIGEPDFAPPEVAGRALAESVEKGFARYGQAHGHPLLRDALVYRATQRYHADVSRDNIMVTPGARFAVFLAISTLNPGDEIITIEPAWPAYRDCALNAGVKVRAIKTTIQNRWEPDIDEIAGAINPNTKMIAINYPNNPTGKILPAKIQDGIVELAMQNDLYILSDEIYEQYARTPYKSMLEYGYDKTVAVQSFSKSHAMTGFRIGYVTAHKDMIQRMARLQALCITSVSEPIQYAALKALESDTTQNTKIINSRLDKMCDMADNMDFVSPDGAMYLFARVRAPHFDGYEFAQRALKLGVAVAPGSGFGDYKEFIRISACQDEKTLKEGMDILNEEIKRVL